MHIYAYILNNSRERERLPLPSCNSAGVINWPLFDRWPEVSSPTWQMSLKQLEHKGEGYLHLSQEVLGDHGDPWGPVNQKEEKKKSVNYWPITSVFLLEYIFEKEPTDQRTNQSVGGWGLKSSQSIHSNAQKSYQEEWYLNSGISHFSRHLNSGNREIMSQRLCRYLKHVH
jgi:hypothetical protein